MKKLLASATSALLLISGPTDGYDGVITPQDGSPDAALARDLVQQGKILPLVRVLDMLERQHPGQITEVELEYEDGLLVYEIDVITLDGRLIEVDMNAATGEIVDIDKEDDD